MYVLRIWSILFPRKSSCWTPWALSPANSCTALLIFSSKASTMLAIYHFKINSALGTKTPPSSSHLCRLDCHVVISHKACFLHFWRLLRLSLSLVPPLMSCHLISFPISCPNKGHFNVIEISWWIDSLLIYFEPSLEWKFCHPLKYTDDVKYVPAASKS